MKTEFPFLLPDSVVVDVGAYLGEWSRLINKVYGCRVISLEPVWSHYLACVDAIPEKCRVYKIGLSGDTGPKTMTVAGDASSFVIRPDSNNNEVINCVDPDGLFSLLKLGQVDLMKMNIEGAEYQVMPYMSRVLPKIRRAYIQFHKEVPHSDELYEDAQRILGMTHVLIERQMFVWDYWVRKDLAGEPE